MPKIHVLLSNFDSRDNITAMFEFDLSTSATSFLLEHKVQGQTTLDVGTLLDMTMARVMYPTWRTIDKHAFHAKLINGRDQADRFMDEDFILPCHYIFRRHKDYEFIHTSHNLYTNFDEIEHMWHRQIPLHGGNERRMECL